jgi:rifampicin phosphotransferase
MAFVADLRDLSRSNIAIAGGKGANLGELIRAGFRVPRGFCVTTDAYDAFVAHNHLEVVLGSDGATIRGAMEAAPMPPELEAAIRVACNRLAPAAPVAIRSSATAEDLPEAAFAGQQDTYLNVIGEVAILDAVRRCWASLWTDRAIAYRQRQQLDPATLKLAVVVQEMVLADVAGVLFTRNPVTGAHNEMVVDASPGLGEAVVSGLVTPDHFRLRKHWWGREVVERRVGNREVVVRPLAGGGVDRVSGQAASSPAGMALRDRDLRRLARLGAAIERHFGSPQDVEWAVAGGRLYVLQARPITALPTEVGQVRSAGPLGGILGGLVGEMLPTRPYPLEASTWGLNRIVSELLGDMFGLVGLAVRFDRSFVEQDGVLVRFTGRIPVQPTPAMALAPIRVVRQARRFDSAQWQHDPLIEEARRRVRELETRDVRSLTWPELLATVREALAVPRLLGQVRVLYIPDAALGLAGLRLLLGLLGRSDRLDTLLSGLQTRTMQSNRELEALAVRIRSDALLADTFEQYEPAELWRAVEAQPSGQAFLAELQTFLDEYGHREAGGTLLVSQSTWKDAPEVVLGMLRGLARAPQPAHAQAPDWRAARDELLRHPLLRLPPIRRAFLAWLARGRRFAPIREDTRFYATMMLPVLNRALLELGRRLAAAGVLVHAEDVWHLRFEELERIQGTWPPSSTVAQELRATVERRKQIRESLRGTPLVDPRLVGQRARGDALVSGIPGGAGVAEGPVRVIRDGSEFGKLQPGEVLVAPYTNPAWTPLFQRAAAVVVDSGGPMSHAAIVAREYGIPAVMATGDGTARLADGDVVRIDGTRGVVERGMST